VSKSLFTLSAGLALNFMIGTSAHAGDLQGTDPRSGKDPIPAREKHESGCHGTSIDFLGTPSEAAKQAKKEQKLVFVLHVSGNFEDPRFT
jgi:hypothetical protein